MLALFVRLVALLAAADTNPPATGLERNIESPEYVWKAVRDNHWDPLRGKPGPAVRLRPSQAAGVTVELSVTRTQRRGEHTQIGHLPTPARATSP